MSDKNFCIAHLSEEEKNRLQEMESQFKTATGKDCVLIAWEEGH